MEKCLDTAATNLYIDSREGPLAQLVEQRPFKAWVEGSIPSRLIGLLRLVVRTPGFHPGNRGSTPLGDGFFYLPPVFPPFRGGFFALSGFIIHMVQVVPYLHIIHLMLYSTQDIVSKFQSKNHKTKEMSLILCYI